MSLPAASPSVLARRVARWAWCLSLFALRSAGSRLRGEDKDQATGRHARAMFEALGATGTKIGQQMSMRVDLLPYAVCQELASLTDAVPPSPLDDARAAIERAAGRPLDEVYARIDPVPIGSASIATVWRGWLHDGRAVAIKVKRPGIDAAFSADLTVFGLWTAMLEALTLVRPGFFRHLRSEVVDMFAEELDLSLEARSQRVFRAAALRDRIHWLTVPDIHHDKSDREVMVSDFQEGLTAAEVLAAVESTDPAARDRLAALDIDPGRVARRIRELGYWGQHEAPLFHADPHPGNILVQSGDQIVLLDFGAVGHTTDRAARLGRRIVGRLRARDPSGAADVALVQSAPYPRLNWSAYRRGAHDTFTRWHRGGQDPEAMWWERSTAVVWLDMVERARVHQIPVNLNTLRLVRCTLLYDTMVCRLDPRISTKGFTRYARKAWRRKARRGDLGMRQPAAAMRRVGPSDPPDLLRTATRVSERSEAMLERLRGLVRARAGAARSTEQFVRVVGLRLLVLLALVWILGAASTGIATVSPAIGASLWLVGMLAMSRQRVRP